MAALPGKGALHRLISGVPGSALVDVLRHPPGSALRFRGTSVAVFSDARFMPIGLFSLNLCYQCTSKYPFVQYMDTVHFIDSRL